MQALSPKSLCVLLASVLVLLDVCAADGMKCSSLTYHDEAWTIMCASSNYQLLPLLSSSGSVLMLILKIDGFPSKGILSWT